MPMDSMTRASKTLPALTLSGLLMIGLSACGGGDGGGLVDTPDAAEAQCTIDLDELLETGVGRDNIPALINPKFVLADDAEADYLLPLDRVIGFLVGDRVLAIPHNILWWHEVLNLNLPEGKFLVTYCPLTGSAIAFDRSAVGGVDFGVSGLLFRNNQVMFDRARPVTLWPQMMGTGVCGPKTGTVLPRIAVTEMTWRAWLEHHPDTEVISSETGWSRDYTQYPYGDYEDLDAPPFLPQRFDQTRQPKERVMAIEGRDGGVLAFPFLELDQLGELGVVNAEVDGEPFLVVWDRVAESAFTFSRISDRPAPGSDAPLTFRVEDGKILDNETGSEWARTGQAVAGELAGAVLPGHPGSMIAFWFAWSAFHPTTSKFVWLAD
ncbi:MAG: DUF3179 domain-containing protein [Gemmatimonadota bacterium]|nr:MAG: DUF3179 domain-containing protein [Gemmatimonadota bacterium]